MIGDLIVEFDEVGVYVVEEGHFDVIIKMLNSIKAGTRKEALWTLNNIMNCSTENIDAFFNHHFLESKIRCALSGKNVGVREEAFGVYKCITR